VTPDIAKLADALAHPADATAAYLTGQMRPSQGALLEAFMAESEATIAALKPELDIPYGPQAREVFDLYVSPKPWRGTLAYFHAGYWQSRDKSHFRFLASFFAPLGVDLALVNYPLCPDVTLAGLTASARRSVPRILATARTLGRGGRDLVAAGHSAGGHLAVELALTHWAESGIAGSPIRAILPISGVFELTPLIGTRLNEKLLLDAEEARAMSPLYRVTGPLPPAQFLVGGLETPEFRAQTEAMAVAWRAGGGEAPVTIVAEADHFSILRSLAPGGAGLSAALSLFGP
jgi:arylformamidase